MQQTDGARLSRPAAPQAAEERQGAIVDGMGRPLKASLDTGSFQLGTGQNALNMQGWNPWAGQVHRDLRSAYDRLAARRPLYLPINAATTILHGNADSRDLTATEARWRPTMMQSSVGNSRITVSTNIAFCPPRDPVMRQNWEQLMRELQDPTTAEIWRKWQETACGEFLQAKVNSDRMFGSLCVHITVTPELLKVNGLTQMNPMAESIAPQLNEALRSPAFNLPKGTNVTEAHITATITETPATTP